MLVPQSLGGSGLSAVDAGVALEESGRVLSPAPLLSSTLAVAVLVDSSDTDRVPELLTQVADGRSIPALALGEGTGWPAGAPTTTAHWRAGHWSLQGAKTMVVGGTQADVLVVAARKPTGETALFIVDARADGLDVVNAASLDLTRDLADVRLTDAAGTEVGGSVQPTCVAEILDLGVVLCAAEQVGAAQRALELTVEYAVSRNQYGRAIGSFQAVKHRCVDMLVEVEYARALSRYAVWAAVAGRAELPVLAGSLKSVVGDGGVTVAEQMIQVHGGIGFTWEHVAHLFYKRALSDRLLFGLASEASERTAAALGFGTGAREL